MTHPTDQLFLGIDIGGTKLHAVVADRRGHVLGRARKKVGKDKRFDAVIQRVDEVARTACARASIELQDVATVGVGAPSPVLADGTAVCAPNLGWSNVPVGPVIGRMVERPCRVANDCDAGTLAETVFGAARGARSAVGLFMGTGLGGGIVVDGKMVCGDHHLAAEVGHMVVVRDGRRCGCGHNGCLEAYASKTGMAARIVAAAKAGRASPLTQRREGKLPKLRAKLLARAYQDRDELAVEVIDEAAEFLGLGVGNLMTLLGPSVVVLGGGVMEAMGELLLDRVRAAAQAVTFPEAAFEHTRIELAALGDDVVALGAVALAMQEHPG
ncbi:MAG: ROK family protein [Deltaproteobacteria bacterium]|nr:ROK family protein [Deltaproteobacteria bacterium]